MNTPVDIATRQSSLPAKGKYTILFGVGEKTDSRVVTCTPSGLKRIITNAVKPLNQWAMAFEGEAGENQSIRSLPRIY